MLDLNKPVETRSGMPVRILCTDREGRNPIIGLIKTLDGSELLGSWDFNGNVSDSSGDYQLINHIKKSCRYANVYKNYTGIGNVYRILEDAKKASGGFVHKRIRMNYEDDVLISVDILDV